jgi:CubicO group peptidase (beta-lactamase class C family)
MVKAMSFVRIALIAAVACLAPMPVAAQPAAPPAAIATTNDPLAGLAAELDAARAAFDVPGLAVTVVAGGRVVFAQGLGQRGIADPAPVDADTRFGLASCSKAFTSFGVGLLVDEGKLRFEDLVSVQDPELTLAQADWLTRLTVADLLSQRSGFARHDFLWHAHPEMTRARFAGIQGLLQMQRAPGERYGYTNTAFILAGRLIELKSGQTWEAFTKARILGPLGMTRSNFSAAGLAEDSNAAKATKRQDAVDRTVPWRDGRLLGPAGSINSTANDMGRWLLLHTQGGAFAGKRLMSEATFNRLWAPIGGADDVAGPRSGDNDKSRYAMGWRVDEWRGQRRISHGGAVDGFRTRVVLFPDRGVGIAVMANLGPSQLPEFAARVIAERMLGLPRATDLTALAAGRREAEVKALSEPPELPKGRLDRIGAKDTSVPPSRTLAEFHGVYRHPAYGDIEIRPSADGTGLRMVFGILAGRLDPWRGDSFIAFSDRPDDTLDESEIVFRNGSVGEVTGFTAMIDNDIAPIPFTRIGALPPPPKPAPAEAKLTGKPSGSPYNPALAALGALGLSLMALAGAVVLFRR